MAIDFDADLGDIVVLSGRASVDDDAGRDADYDTKYAARMAGLGLTPEQFAARYAVVLRIALTRLRGH